MSRTSRRALLALLGSAWLAPAKQRAAKRANGNSPVIEIKRKVSLLAPQPVSYEAKPLRPGALPNRGPAPAVESGAYIRHYANLQLNSRLTGALPADGTWRLRWSADLPGAALSVIRNDDRIAVQWPGMWRLYDDAGRQLHEDYSGQSPLVLDPRARMLQLITSTSYWEARALSTGELQFRNALPYDESYSWPVLDRKS